MLKFGLLGRGLSTPPPIITGDYIFYEMLSFPARPQRFVEDTGISAEHRHMGTGALTTQYDGELYSSDFLALSDDITVDVPLVHTNDGGEITLPTNSYFTRFDFATQQWVQVSATGDVGENIIPNGDFSDGTISPWVPYNGVVSYLDPNSMSVSGDGIDVGGGGQRSITGDKPRYRWSAVISSLVGNGRLLKLGGDSVTIVFDSGEGEYSFEFDGVDGTVYVQGNNDTGFSCVVDEYSQIEMLPISTTYHLNSPCKDAFSHDAPLSEADLTALNDDPNLIYEVAFNDYVLPSGFSVINMVSGDTNAPQKVLNGQFDNNIDEWDDDGTSIITWNPSGAIDIARNGSGVELGLLAGQQTVTGLTVGQRYVLHGNAVAMSHATSLSVYDGDGTTRLGFTDEISSPALQTLAFIPITDTVIIGLGARGSTGATVTYDDVSIDVLTPSFYPMTEGVAGGAFVQNVLVPLGAVNADVTVQQSAISGVGNTFVLNGINEATAHQDAATIDATFPYFHQIVGNLSPYHMTYKIDVLLGSISFRGVIGEGGKMLGGGIKTVGEHAVSSVIKGTVVSGGRLESNFFGSDASNVYPNDYIINWEVRSVDALPINGYTEASRTALINQRVGSVETRTVKDASGRLLHPVVGQWLQFTGKGDYIDTGIIIDGTLTDFSMLMVFELDDEISDEDEYIADGGTGINRVGLWQVAGTADEIAGQVGEFVIPAQPLPPANYYAMIVNWNLANQTLEFALNGSPMTAPAPAVFDGATNSTVKIGSHSNTVSGNWDKKIGMGILKATVTTEAEWQQYWTEIQLIYGVV